jgi:DNA-binding MarR family transcriptional regulator
MSKPDAVTNPLADLYSKPGHLIRRCQQIAVAVFLEETIGFDITSVQYAAMVAIRHHPSIDATRLSQLVAFDRSTLGTVLLRLEQKKLVKRTSSVEDRRVKRIVLTKAGQALLEEMEGPVERAQARILEPLSPKDQEVFLELIERLVNINNKLSRAPATAQDA